MATNRMLPGILALAAVASVAGLLNGQAPPAEPTPASAILPRPDPKEIPLPVIKTSMAPMPGVDQLPNRPEMPDVMTLNNGQKVKTAKQWEQRREEMKRTLEWYAVGQAPPPPGNVKGKEISSEMLMDGKVKYRLVHLTFGPNESLSLDIGIFTPVGNNHAPTLISPSGTPPGATALPRLASGVNQGRNEDVLLVTGPAAPGAGGPGGFGGPGGPRPAVPDGAGGAPVAGMGGPARPAAPGAAGAAGAAGAPRRVGFGGPRTAAQIAESNQAIQQATPSSPSTMATAARTPPSAMPTEAGPTAPRASSLLTLATTGASSAPGPGESRASSITSRLIRRSTRPSSSSPAYPAPASPP